MGMAGVRWLISGRIGSMEADPGPGRPDTEGKGLSMFIPRKKFEKQPEPMGP